MSRLQTDLGALLAGEVEQLARVVTRTFVAEGESGGDAGAGGGLETVELAVRTAMMGLDAALLEGLLGGDAGYRGPRVDCPDGHPARFVGYRDKTLDTVLGRIRVRRAYYHCGQCHCGVVPRDASLGVAATSASPGLTGMIARAGAALPFAQAAGLIGDLAGVGVSAKRVERSAETTGRELAEALDTENTAILTRQVLPLPPRAPCPDKLYIAIDGTGVPMRPAETTGRAGKYPDGKARTREVKLASLFAQTRCDAKGFPLRDPDSTSYLASFEPAGVFGRAVLAESRRRGAEHIRQLVVLGDGAAWIWNQATQRWPEATQIVDIYHAREHLHEIVGLLAESLGDDLETWKAARLAELDAGNITDMLTAIRKPLPRDGKCHALDKALSYFETNARLMDYARFRRLGMFIGSGVVEAGCKAVIGQRLKLSGMRWTITGATGITTLRCAHASPSGPAPHDHTITA
ncbi:MAG: ISKra4 family transposase [Actinomycetales bacterium]